jgi:cobalt-zinc-cadmium efflux system outer membrane protein
MIKKAIVHLKKLNNAAILSLIAMVCFTWGTVFASPSEQLFDRSETLSPEKLVTLVLQRNPDIQAASAASLAAKEHIDQVGVLDDPIVKYSVAPRTLSNPDIDPRHSIAVSQRLPWSGKLKLKKDRARYQANASVENIKLTQLKLTEMARVGFARWYFVHAALRINKHNQSLVDEFKQIADIKYSAGKVSKQDVLQADMEFLLLQQQAITLRRQRLEIQAELNKLLHRETVDYVPDPVTLARQNSALDQQTLFALALRQHPALRALEQMISGEKSNVRLADKASFPDFTVNALYNGVMDPSDKRLQISVAVNVPFGNKYSAKKRESRARLNQLQWQQQSTISSIKTQVQQALDRLQESQQLLQLYKERLLPLAQENLSTAKQDYETGRGDFLSLIIAEKSLSKTQLDQERILTEYYQRLAQLDRVVGRAFTETDEHLENVNMDNKKMGNRALRLRTMGEQS